jgi:hypothetical protein
MRRIVFGPFLIVLSLSVGSSRASAQAYTCDSPCGGYLDPGGRSCNGDPTCQEYPTYCTSSGCICGQCVSHGGSGDCCGLIYYSAVVYPGSGACPGDCGYATTHGRMHVARGHRKNPHESEVRGRYSPGLIMLNATASYRPASIVYVYSNCSHDLRLVVE